MDLILALGALLEKINLKGYNEDIYYSGKGQSMKSLKGDTDLIAHDQLIDRRAC